MLSIDRFVELIVYVLVTMVANIFLFPFASRFWVAPWNYLFVGICDFFFGVAFFGLIFALFRR